MEARAVAKGLRAVPRKTRLMIDLIRNKSVNEASDILNNYNSKGARMAKSVLDSAVANAVNNLGLDRDKLVVKETYVDEGQTMKRVKFGGKGSIKPRKKRTCHITIVVSDLEDKEVN